MAERILSLSSIQRLWEKTQGKAWEPPDRNHPTVKSLIDGGWVKPCPMRCGFEAFDTGVKWTDAARIALTTQEPTP
jgi:hypothetical protein